MMERKIIFSINEFYHLYNRGVEKRIIFVDYFDYDRFIKLLYLCNGTNSVVMKSIQGDPLDGIFKLDVGEKIVDIGAYCLMPNHFHILLKEKINGGTSLFMLKLLTAYSMYFNKKYDHLGPLFQRPFKAKHLDNDNYLKYLYAYIHLNPIKIVKHDWKEKGIGNINKAKNFLANYKYSSYLDYLREERPQKRILNKTVFPGYFIGIKEFNNFIDYWLDYKDEDEGKDIQGVPLDKRKGDK